MKANEDLTSELIYNAKIGKHRPFQYIQNYKEYYRARKICRVERLLVGSLRQSSSKLFKRYCKDITTGEADVYVLLAYRTLTDTLRFYEEELKIISDMVVEYECYLANGNLMDFILGNPRPLSKQWDHRSL